MARSKRMSLDLGDVAVTGVKLVATGALLWVAYFSYQVSKHGL